MSHSQSSQHGNERLPGRFRRSRWLLASLLLLVLAGLAAWLLVGDDDPAAGTASATPRAVTAAELRALSDDLGRPIFWLGPPQAGQTLELTRTSAGRVFLRYLPRGAELGSGQRQHPTVATYPAEDAYAVALTGASRSGGQVTPLQPGVAVITYPARSRNAYYVERSLPVQVELYDPTPGRAARILRAGKLRSVPSAVGVANRPTEATLAALAALPESVGHPVYWAGARRDSTYELTQTSAGLYIRYLPKDGAIGDRRPSFLTVASYPSTRTFAQEEARARRAGAVIRSLEGGRKSIEPVGQSTSVYLIVRGQDVLVEVYSPVPGQAARLIARGTVVPLG